MTPAILEDMAKDFWIKNGKNPSKLFLSNVDKIEFSKLFYPKERKGEFTATSTPTVEIYVLENNVNIDIIGCDQDLQPFMTE